MKTHEIQKLWALQNEKLERNWTLNLHILKEMKLGETKSALRRFIIGRIVFALFNLCIMFWMGSFIGDHWGSWIMIGPAVLVHLLSLAALVSSIQQAVWASQIEYSKPITTIQKIIEVLRVKSLKTNRLIFLSSYYFSFFLIVVFIHADIVDLIVTVWTGAPWVVIIHGTMALLWVPFGLWLLRKYQDPKLSSRFFIKLRDESRLTKNSASSSINSALGFIDELREFENED